MHLFWRPCYDALSLSRDAGALTPLAGPDPAAGSPGPF